MNKNMKQDYVKHILVLNQLFNLIVVTIRYNGENDDAQNDWPVGGRVRNNAVA